MNQRTATFRALVFVIVVCFGVGARLGSALQRWAWRWPGDRPEAPYLAAAPRSAATTPMVWPPSNEDGAANGFDTLSLTVLPTPEQGAPATVAAPPSPDPRTVTPALPVPLAGPPEPASLLILGVDSLASSAPALKAVWIAQLAGAAPRAYLLGLPPATLADHPLYGERRLSDFYSLDRQADSGGDLFLEALAHLHASPVDATITIDARTLVHLIDRLVSRPPAVGSVAPGSGGSGEAGVTDGLGALEFLLGAGPDDPAGQLRRQAALIEAMLAAARARGEQFDLAAYLDLIAATGRADLSRPELAALLRPLLPLSAAEIVVAPIPDSAMTLTVAADGRPAVRLSRSLAAIP